ncbi:ABC transporter ATP-binding protein [Actinophytocola xinjiangensis]|uniref:ABC transporter ATP-binding protein n=1 Tax=Actinophytocola xinjiangensis TaxID=485602 RepID=A0A7Z0WS73_9PSEU|nr:ABC transporter ATP-binding protein [Actinophytocola xinjiangensis]
MARWFDVKRARVTALESVSFEIRAGEVVTVLGTNGAGKTTLTKILSTLLLPSRGTVLVNGHDVAADPRGARAATGVIFGGDRGLYTRLSGRDNLRFFGMLSGVGRRDLRQRLPGALEQVGLAGAADRAVETYSKGMRQRLHIAIGLIGRPRVLLLDEPTVGLDPVEAQRLRAAVADLRADGAAIMLTSHNLLDVERLADRVLMLRGGRITHDLPLPEFVRQVGHTATVTVRGRGRPPAPGALPDGVTVSEVADVDGGWEATFYLRGWDRQTFDYLGGFMADADVLDCAVRESRVDDAFARLAGAVG